MQQMNMPPHTISVFQKSLNDFRSARQKAALEEVFGRLTGKSIELLSYEEVTQKLKVTGQIGRGVQDIPVEAIVGSVGRYSDFSRTFLPRRDSDAQRWAKVASIADFDQLPPIEVYQIGDAYFVLDGNHRVSIARQRGRVFIPAEVIEVRTRVPLSPGVNPDELILQAEYAVFLENTQLDHLRPDTHLRVSVPGQYRKLENHMEVHRFFIETAEERELSDREAVTRWYDEAYLPVVQAVREQGILADFPGRTEADLYVWIAEHQAALRNELGWQIRPEVATADLAARFQPKPPGKVTRLGTQLGQKIINVVVPESWKTAAKSESWSQTKVAARYSDRLFADLLVVLTAGQDNTAIIQQALAVAGRDGSRLHGLTLAVGDERTRDGQAEQAAQLQTLFYNKCQAAGVEGRLAFQPGDPIEVICERAALADLIITGRSLSQPGSSAEAGRQLLALIRRSPRPMLISAGETASLDNILLAYDGGNKGKEALFAAAYMAERWGAALTVVIALESGTVGQAAVDHAHSYLEMHEVEATYRVKEAAPAGFILHTAAEQQAQLIIAGGYSRRRFGRSGIGDVVSQLLRDWRGPVLVCP
jgi:nucleotide-binding universal stress UspA family protein